MQKLSKKQISEVGVLISLLLVMIGLYSGLKIYFVIASGCLVLVILLPSVFKPFAILWFGIAKYLNKVFSALLLSFIYAIVLLPVSLTIRLFGKDSLMLRSFKQGNGSVFKTREHIYQEDELSKPY